MVVRLRALVLDSNPQVVAQAGGSDARLLLLWRQLADRFTKMKPAAFYRDHSTWQLCRLQLSHR